MDGEKQTARPYLDLALNLNVTVKHRSHGHIAKL